MATRDTMDITVSVHWTATDYSMVQCVCNRQSDASASHIYNQMMCSHDALQTCTYMLWGVAGHLMRALLPIYNWFWRQKNSKNRSTYGKVMNKRVMYCFFDSWHTSGRHQMIHKFQVFSAICLFGAEDFSDTTHHIIRSYRKTKTCRTQRLPFKQH